MAATRTFKIPFQPKAIHGIYGVNYYFQKKDAVSQRLQFEAIVEYCGQYMEEYSLYHISKKEYVVNRNESDEYLYDIAKKCADIIYPISVLLDMVLTLSTSYTYDRTSLSWTSIHSTEP